MIFPFYELCFPSWVDVRIGVYIIADNGGGMADGRIKYL